MKTKPIYDNLYIQEDNKNLFEIFSYNNDVDWANAKILDFGCNVGNYLNHAVPFIKKENYVGIDLNNHSLSVARVRHPEASFVFYNKYHQSFNPTGVDNIRINDVLNEKFDVIIAYSVFTHCSVNEMKAELKNLLEVLKPGGCILFTVWSHDFFKRFHEYLLSRLTIEEFDCDSVEYDEVLYWVDYGKVFTDDHDIHLKDCKSLCTFYKLDKFQELFPEAELLGHPPGKTQSQKLFRIIK